MVKLWSLIFVFKKELYLSILMVLYINLKEYYIALILFWFNVILKHIKRGR